MYNMITLTKILEIVITEYRVIEEDVKSKSRHRHIVTPRHVYCYFARYYTKKSLSEIGNIINRDHSSAIHSIKEIEDKLSLKFGEEGLKIMVDLITNRILNYNLSLNKTEDLIPTTVNLLALCA